MAAVVSMITIATTEVEMIHFPQYGMLAYLLALSLDHDRTHWPLVTILLLVYWLGVIDELNQYFYLTPNSNAYVDFNDFLLNLIGGCAGLLAYYGFESPPQLNRLSWSTSSRATVSIYGLSALFVTVLILLGRIRYAPQTTVEPGGTALIDGVLRIYLQREPDLLSSWQPSFSGDQYYVTGAPECLVVTIVAIVLTSVYRRLGLRRA